MHILPQGKGSQIISAYSSLMCVQQLQFFLDLFLITDFFFHFFFAKDYLFTTGILLNF